MHVEQVHEPVEVLVAFRQKRTEPMAFRWGGRLHQLQKTNLVHTQQNGREAIHYFSVSAEGASYRLAFYPRALRWMLEEVWLE